MYGYNMDQNPKELIYSLNFKAPHRVFVKQWEIAEFTIGETVFFFKQLNGTNNKFKWANISPIYAEYNHFFSYN